MIRVAYDQLSSEMKKEVRKKTDPVGATFDLFRYGDGYKMMVNNRGGDVFTFLTMVTQPPVERLTVHKMRRQQPREYMTYGTPNKPVKVRAPSTVRRRGVEYQRQEF